MCKTVEINNLKMNALVDTGSAVNIIREDKAAEADLTNFEKSRISLSAFGGGKVFSSTSVDSKIRIDENEFDIKMQTVPKNITKYEIILGISFFNNAEILVTKEGVNIKKPNAEMNIMNINVIENQVESDLSHIEDKKHKKEIEELVGNYKPKAEKFIDVQMKIILNNESPYFDSPRRLPYAE